MQKTKNRTLKMRLLIVFTLICVQSPALGNDKLQHFAVSAGMTYGIGFILNQFLGGKETAFSSLTAGLTVLSIGLAFEIGQSFGRNDRRIDEGDMLANGAGIGAGIIALQLTF